MSVLRYECLPDEYRENLRESPGAVGANGTPLDVVGKVNIGVSLGSYSVEEEFTVIRNLTVDCLLGADFLKEHCAVMDCRSGTLSIGKERQYRIPMFTDQQPQSQSDSTSIAITAPVDMIIPGRTVQLIQAELEEETCNFNEALVEPDIARALPKSLCTARSLTPVLSGKTVILQVMNISPTPVTIYKGMRLGEAIPRHCVLLVDHDNVNIPEPATVQTDPIPLQSIIDRHDLSSEEKTQLLDLLTQFANLFTVKNGLVGQTKAVKHSILTEGPSVRQPLQRITETLK